MSKRFLSLLLAFVLCMSCLALPAFASDPYVPPGRRLFPERPELFLRPALLGQRLEL